MASTSTSVCQIEPERLTESMPAIDGLVAKWERLMTTSNLGDAGHTEPGPAPWQTVKADDARAALAKGRIASSGLLDGASWADTAPDYWEAVKTELSLKNWRTGSDEHRRSMLQQAGDWVRNWTPASHGWVFTGPTGRGKTRLARAMLFEIIARNSVNGLWLQVPEVMAEIQASYRDRGDSRSEGDFVEAIASARIVVFDEVASIAVDNTARTFWREKLSTLVAAADRAQCCIISTLNLTRTGLTEWLGDRTVPRRLWERAQERDFTKINAIYGN